MSLTEIIYFISGAFSYGLSTRLLKIIKPPHTIEADSDDDDFDDDADDITEQSHSPYRSSNKIESKESTELLKTPVTTEPVKCPIPQGILKSCPMCNKTAPLFIGPQKCTSQDCDGEGKLKNHNIKYHFHQRCINCNVEIIRLPDDAQSECLSVKRI